MQLAGAAIIVELLVQIPFVRPSPLQAILALVAITTIVLGRRARRLGWAVGTQVSPSFSDRG